MKIRCRLHLPSLCLVAVVAMAVAQSPAKRPLTHQDYDSWRSIQSPLLSRDGKYAAYALFPQEGDGEIVVRSLRSAGEWRVPAGALPPPPDPDSSAAPEEEAPRRGIRRAFTADSRFLIASTYPPKSETDKARRERKRPEEMPKGGIAIVDVATGGITSLANVRSFQTPEKAGSWLAYLKESAPVAQPASGETAERRAPPRGGRQRAQYGTDLVLRDLTKAESSERVFPNVLEYTFSKDGKTLVYTVSSRKEEENGINQISPGASGDPTPLLAGKGKYSRPTWNREQSRLAFLSDRDDAGQRQPKFKLYLWDRSAAAAKEIVSTAIPGFRSGFVISDRGALSFSRDGSRLFLGSAPPAPPERETRETDAAPPEDRVVVDLWHWRDDYIQPMQKVRANQDRSRTYRAVFHIAENKFVQLADPTLQQITPSDDGRLAIGADDRAYRQMNDFDGSYADYFLVDTMTGARKPLLQKFPGGFGGGGAPRGPAAGRFGGGGRVSWAPDARHVSFFRDKQWHTLRIPDLTLATLTSSAGVNFFNEDHNTPDAPSSYGSAGWTKDGKSVLLYDRYDIWQASPDGKPIRNITEGFGRRENLQFRVLRLDADEDEEEERGIDPAKPLLLRAENLVTRDTGFWRDRLEGSAPPQKLLMGAKSFRPASKADDAEVYLLTASTFHDYPDLYWTDGDFRELRKVSDANPQKAQLLWGTAEMVRFHNADGAPLQAVLLKPENFDPAKKYPMLVYIYERLSQNLHSFRDPSPGTSINPTYYVSNGYLVLMPDIVYTVGYPGQSALKCVLPAIQEVVDRSFVNENAIGIQGHSWGGYQIAYMVTQTRRFRAASAGAPVGNMTSAYNGIRWGPGRPRQFQYEAGQSRIGGSIWQYPMRFVENSPIFMADRVETPLLILHNDQDDAVPWYQGIELFLSLRRLGKEAYMFNYNGERHGLRRRHNQKDYTVRLQEFFDHYLKGAPRPDWMEKGLPYLEREPERRSATGANGR